MDKKNITVFISLITCGSIVLFILSQISTYALTTFQRDVTTYSNQTTIGKIDISSLEQEQAVETVNTRISNWEKKENIQLTFLNRNQKVSNRVFQFLVSDSFQSVQNGKKNALKVDINHDELHNLLKQLGMESIIGEVDLDKLTSLLRQYAENLSEDSLVINMDSFLKGFNLTKKSKLSQVEISFDHNNVMEDWLANDNIVLIKPNQVFSFNTTIKNMNQYINNDYDSISKISSTIYKAALQTNLQVIERNISQTVPLKVELGYEAYIDGVNMDLKLYNPNDYTISMISKKIASNTMEIIFEGPYIPLQYKISTENEKKYTPKTLVNLVPSKSLERTEEGRNGYSIEVYKGIYVNQLLIDRQLVSKDFYLPVENIEYKYQQNESNIDSTSINPPDTDQALTNNNDSSQVTNDANSK